MKNYVQEGHMITVTAPYAVNSGDFVKVGGIIGVAAGNALINTEVEIRTFGVFRVTKTTGQTWTVGEPVYWDDDNKKVSDSVLTDTAMIGYAVLAAESSDTTGTIWLIPGAAFGV